MESFFAFPPSLSPSALRSTKGRQAADRPAAAEAEAFREQCPLREYVPPLPPLSPPPPLARGHAAPRIGLIELGMTMGKRAGIGATYQPSKQISSEQEGGFIFPKRQAQCRSVKSEGTLSLTRSCGVQ